MPEHRASQFPAYSAIALGVAILTIAAAIAGCGGGENNNRSLKGFTRTPTAQVGAVGLPDVAPKRAGLPMAFRAKPGGLLLTYFGYTYCPDICPTTFADVRSALRKLPAAQRRRVTVAMVTVDPARDTPKVLNGYLGHFFTAWHALRTTDQGALRRAEQAFGATHEIGPRRADGNYDVSHTALLYAVDERGIVRVEWPFGTPSADIAADLQTLLGDQRAPA